MMVMVNAISVKEGGSLVVLARLLEAMIHRRPDIEWFAAVHPSVQMQSSLPDEVALVTFRSIDRSPADVLFWYEWALPRLIRRIGADVLFSQTNYLPRRRVACPSLLLEQHAGHFSSNFAALMERELSSRISIAAWRSKSAWVHNSVRVAERVLVQTSALADAIRDQAHVPAERIDVVPHGSGLVAHADRPRARTEDRSWRIGYVSKHGVQKDFATALRALRALRDRGHDATMVLTLDPAQPATASVERQAAEIGVAAHVENAGAVAAADMQALYDGFDAFVFPSVCESFGFPLVEAMARGVPVAIARTASNLEVAGPGAMSFDAGDWRGLADTVEFLMEDAAVYAAQARRSLDTASALSWDRAAAGTLRAIDRVVGIQA